MICVRLFGLLRLDSGIRRMELDAATVAEVFDALCAASESITQDRLSGCVLLINGRQGNKKSRLRDGDELMLLSPVAGG